MKIPYFSDDVLDFLYLLFKYKVKYLIVGGEAVIYYGYARLTGDIDFFYNTDSQNINNLYSALSEFWDNDIPEISEKNELLKNGTVIQFGVPPNRIDLLNSIENVNFNIAWQNKIVDEIEYKSELVKIYYIGLDELISNKKAIKRNKDKDDLNFLNEVKKKKF